ncbi:ABC transporter ATP-binding protein [Natronobacterium texcoconense]|uniref:ABC-2 type transport system ATP-binding protein n=1 Tax=Natronobacterium texcoconense TaxID=1095778 RepID=A0A1H1HSV5_NATTX|nr:ABC transporter ATP-binding protein [Natronobacterium texcoconense]SDR28497.1 ABC-2 type transport system ATP-binding protein [Natronobacterium texcoconense]
MSDVALRSRDVRKEFGSDERDRVLEGATLDVREGEILLLMGPNGVGKTVLLSCFAGSERPTEGEIEVFGRRPQAVAGDHLGFLLQDSVAVETLTGRENVDFYAGLQPNFTDRWETYVDDLGIADDLDKLVENYSEGMKRKLEFALTMSTDVPLYLLDEPTAGVDLTNVQRFHDVLLERHEANPKTTTVVSSHRPMDANVADRIAFMPDGTITAVGTPEELLERVPTVVRVTGREAMRVAEEYVADGQLFPLGGEARGFLEACDVETVRQAVAESDRTDRGHAAVTPVEPNYTDLFNFSVHVDR